MTTPRPAHLAFLDHSNEFEHLAQEKLPPEAPDADALAPLDAWWSAHGPEALRMVLLSKQLSGRAYHETKTFDSPCENHARSWWLAKRVQEMHRSDCDPLTMIKSIKDARARAQMAERYLGNLLSVYNLVVDELRAVKKINTAAKLRPLAVNNFPPQDQQTNAWVDASPLLDVVEAALAAAHVVYENDDTHAYDITVKLFGQFAQMDFAELGPAALTALFHSSAHQDPIRAKRLLNVIDLIFASRPGALISADAIIPPDWINDWVDFARQRGPVPHIKRTLEDVLLDVQGSTAFHAIRALLSGVSSWEAFERTMDRVDLVGLHKVNWGQLNMENLWTVFDDSKAVALWSRLTQYLFDRLQPHLSVDALDEWFPPLALWDLDLRWMAFDPNFSFLDINHSWRPQAPEFLQQTAANLQYNLVHMLVDTALPAMMVKEEQIKKEEKILKLVRKIQSRADLRAAFETAHPAYMGRVAAVLLSRQDKIHPGEIQAADAFIQSQAFQEAIGLLPAPWSNTTRLLLAMARPSLEPDLLAPPFSAAQIAPITPERNGGIFGSQDTIGWGVSAQGVADLEHQYKQKAQHYVLQEQTQTHKDQAPSAPRSKM